jgi:hypothetical protein
MKSMENKNLSRAEGLSIPQEWAYGLIASWVADI